MVTPAKVVDDLKGKEPKDIIQIIKSHCLKTKPVSIWQSMCIYSFKIDGKI